MWASQAGSQQPAASQPGSQQPLPASQAGSQQLSVQLWHRFFAEWIALNRPRRRCSLRQPVSQQLLPASQAGSQQPLPASQAGSQQPSASQPGSQQPLPASQAGSQQLSSQQLLCFALHFANRLFSPPKSSCFLRHPVSQQLLPASQAGSQHPFPASQAGSQQPLASQPGSQQPLPASQAGSQQESQQPLWPSIRSRSSKPYDWLQTVALRASTPRYNIRFIEPHLLCLWIRRGFESHSARSRSPRGLIHELLPRQACRAVP
jgi:hypothetical protein